jgi:hypothetical protein
MTKRKSRRRRNKYVTQKRIKEKIKRNKKWILSTEKRREKNVPEFS